MKAKYGLRLSLLFLFLFALFAVPAVAQYEPGTIRVMAWSPDGQTLAVGLIKPTAGIELYRQDGTFIKSITTELNGNSVSWSPDGSRISGYTGDYDYQIFDVASGSTLLTFEQIGASRDYTLYWHPAGEGQIATVAGTVVFIREEATGEIISTLVSPDPRNDTVLTLRWYAEGNKILTLSSNDILRIWDVSTATIVTEFQQAYDAYSMATNADVTQAAVGGNDGTVRIVDLASGEIISTFSVSASSDLGKIIYNVEWQPKGNKIAAVSFEAITVWNNHLRRINNVIPLPEQKTWPNTVVYAPSGRLSYAATGTGFAIAPLADTGPPQALIDVNGDGSELVMLAGIASSDSDGAIVSYTWSEEGNTIATGINPEVSLDVGTHTILLTITDDSGATDANEVVIVVNNIPIPTDLLEVIAECISDTGIQTSLIARIEAGQWQAIINEVEALESAKITPECAVEIVEMAEYFIENPPPE